MALAVLSLAIRTRGPPARTKRNSGGRLLLGDHKGRSTAQVSGGSIDMSGIFIVFEIFEIVIIVYELRLGKVECTLGGKIT